MTGHSFDSDNLITKITGRAICSNCGLLRLRNLLTDWCVSKGCEYADHPGIAQARRTLPGQHRKTKNDS